MLKINCDICEEELNEPAALLFSPPIDKIVVKIDICKMCYETLILPVLIK